VHPWGPAELGAFLDRTAGDRLGTLFEVMAMTGLRRGEALGLRWDDVDLERGRIVVRQQVVQVDEVGRASAPGAAKSTPNWRSGGPRPPAARTG